VAASGQREPCDSNVSGAACAECLRRGWLLAELSAVLDCNCRGDGRLSELLELGDGELIGALGGRRRDELQRRHAAFRASELVRVDGVTAVCRHAKRFPARARAAKNAAALHVLGDVECVARLGERALVAFVGRACASDYGLALAASFGRELAAAGVTVAASLLDGIGPSALEAALARGGTALGLIAGGADTGVPARRRALRGRLVREGCAAAELPCGVQSRRWMGVAAERRLAELADVVLCVESDDGANALAGAVHARTLGRAVAAVPGRVSSYASRGPHALLRDGACVVTCTSDVLDLLCDVDRRSSVREACSERPAYEGLDPILRELLLRVGAGEDTPGRLLGAREDAGELLRALGELELMGLLGRGDGGRYVLREPLADARLRYGVRGQMEP
jgi:DNA processing protein